MALPAGNYRVSCRSSVRQALFSCSAATSCVPWWFQEFPLDTKFTTVVYSIVWLHSYSCPYLLGFCARMRSTCSLLYSCLFPFSPLFSHLATASAIPISCVLCVRVCATNIHNNLLVVFWYAVALLRLPADRPPDVKVSHLNVCLSETRRNLRGQYCSCISGGASRVLVAVSELFFECQSSESSIILPAFDGHPLLSTDAVFTN